MANKSQGILKDAIAKIAEEKLSEAPEETTEEVDETPEVEEASDDEQVIEVASEDGEEKPEESTEEESSDDAEKESLDAVSATGLQQTHRPVDVDRRVQLWVLDRRPDPGPRSEMDDGIDPLGGKQVVYGLARSYVTFDQPESLVSDKAFHVAALDRRVVERIEVVQRQDIESVTQKSLGEMRSDESGAAGDQDTVHRP